VLLLAAVVLLVGVWQVREMRVDILPEFTPPTVEVQTEALGLSASEVEQLVTTPIEQDFLNGVAFLDTIRSRTLPGLSQIQLTFDRGTDIYKARQVVQERLSQTHVLPNVSKPPTMLQPLSSTSRVMMIGLSSESLSLLKLSELTRWTIRPRLSGVEGVANVSVYGQREPQVQVQVDPERLRGSGVNLDQLIRSTGNALVVSPLSYLEASTPGTGGFIDAPNQRLSIQHLQPILTPEDLGKVVIEKDPANPDGPQRRIGEVATVVNDHQPLIGDGMLTKGPGLVLVVDRFPDANTLEVTRDLRAAIDSLRPGLSGVEIDETLFQPATFVESSVDNVTKGVAAAAVLLLVGLALLLFGWRDALVSVVAIPLSLVAATTVLHLRGTALNGFVLAGLLLALVVLIDDSLSDREGIVGRLQRRRLDGPAVAEEAAVEEASAERRSHLTHATIIIVVALVPVLFLGGLSSESFLIPVATSYGLAVLASFVVASTVTPALSLLLAPKGPSRERGSPFRRWIVAGHTAGLRRVLRTPRVALLAGGALLLLGVLALPRLEHSLLPSFKDTNLLVRWNAAQGTSLPEMNRVLGLAGRELASLPGVERVGGHAGRAVAGDQIVNVNGGELWITLDPNADYRKTVTAVKEVVAGYPGIDREVENYPEARVNQLLGQTDKAVTVRLFGIDPGVMRSKADEVREVIAQIDGIVDEEVELQGEEASVEIEVDLAAAQRVGVVPGDVRRSASAMLSGIQVGSIFEQQKVFEVMVIGSPETRASLSSIRSMLVATPTGGQVPLGELAKVRVSPSPTVIRHDAASRSVDVTASVQGRSLDAVIADVERSLAQVKMPLEYHAELRRGLGDQRSAERRVQAMALAAGLVILLLLQAAFNSWRLAALFLVTVPLALSGGVMAAVATGGEFSVGSFVGLIGVLGITIRHGVMLVRHFQHLEGSEATRATVVTQGTQDRAPQIVMTGLLTALAVAPFALLGEVAGLEVVRPMVLVLLGGLVTATIVNLFLVPAFYLLFGHRPQESTAAVSPSLIKTPRPVGQ